MHDVLPCKYVSGNGTVLEFGTNVNFLNEGDIRDYEWSYTTLYDKIKSFNKELTIRTLPVYFYGDSMYRTAEHFYEVADRDVMTTSPGKLYIGDYFIKAYISASSKLRYTNGTIINENLSVLSDFRWWNEIYKEFGAGELEHIGKLIDYPRDYKMDYAPPGSNAKLKTDAVAPFEFEITFQGAVVNPTLIVGDRIYRVYTELLPAEHLTVNSLDRTVYRTKVRGAVVNEFHNRDRENYIFEKMPVEGGISRVVWQKGHVVSIKAFVERSEPKWI